MKKKSFLIGFLFVFVAEIIVLIVFAVQTPNFSQNAVDVNEVVKSVTEDFHTIENHKNRTSLNYVVLDTDDNLIYRTKFGLSESLNSAITHRDTILDVEKNGVVVGKLIIYNDGVKSIQSQKQMTITILLITIIVQFVLCLGYAVHLYMVVVRPFQKMKKFAEIVAVGNLDVPLEMDKHNLFGAFTESFDIMRSELKKAQIAEAQANASKKELVAKLSHDIKTPVASIKAVSEVSLAVCQNSKDKESYLHIINKSDQINTLISNLFTATLEELQQLEVTPSNFESLQIRKLLKNADYLNKAVMTDIPECLVYADKLRLQQVFDNIFANSYKYAKTELFVEARRADNYLKIIIEDFGGGVKQEEIHILKEKFKRGSNSKDVEGVGLGLYISNYFMKEMKGELDIENGEHGLKVTVSILLS